MDDKLLYRWGQKPREEAIKLVNSVQVSDFFPDYLQGLFCLT